MESSSSSSQKEPLGKKPKIIANVEEKEAEDKEEEQSVVAAPAPAPAIKNDVRAADSDGGENQPFTSIFIKLENLDVKIEDKKGQIDGVETRIKQKENEINEVKARIAELEGKGEPAEKEMAELVKQTNAYLKDQQLTLKDLELETLDLEIETRELEKETLDLEKEKLTLRCSFAQGFYYGWLSDYWKVGAKEPMRENTSQGLEAFVRDAATVNRIQCRTNPNKEQASKKGHELEKADDLKEGHVLVKSYLETKNDAKAKSTTVAGSATTSAPASSQGLKVYRDQIWPVDIFGNSARNQPIAHIIPGGRLDCKEWVDIAATAMGLSLSASWLTKKKALRGVKSGQSRKAGSGIVHFTSNKLRLNDQANLLDKGSPRMMIIPVMTVDEVKKWTGGAYDAIVSIGLPRGVLGMERDVEDESAANSDMCVSSGLARVLDKKPQVIRDALPREIEAARKLLRQAIVALEHYVKNRSQDDIDNLLDIEKNASASDNKIKRRTTLIDQSKNPTRVPLPENVDDTSSQVSKGPLCLVSFSSVDAKDGHPAPDPLLLAFRMANIWGRMVGVKLLANGKEECDDYENMSEGDIIAEEAFYDWKFGHPKNPTWEELAVGLGQPNGYQDPSNS